MAGTFTGKYAFRSTNASGPTCYLRIQSRDDSLAPVMNGTAPPATAPDERFMTYDAGGGARTLVTVAELTGALWYGYVDDGTGWLFMVDTPAGATPIRWSSATGDRVTWTYTAKNARALSMRYTVGGDESSLIFSDLAVAPGGPAPQLSELSCVELAPGVSKMRETKLAKGGDFQHVDLTGADLSGIDFTGADFRGATLTGAKFPGATLVGVKFAGATLSGVTVERTALDGAHFTGVDLRGVIWHPPFTARKTFFLECSAAGVQMGASDPQHAPDLSGADLSGADFTGANLANVTLEGATLDGTGLVGATLDGANLNRAIIRSVNLTDASLVGAKMAGVQSVVVRFTLSAPGDVSAMVGYLDGDDTLRVRTVFENHGVALTGVIAAAVRVPDRVWTVVQIADGTTYEVQRPDEAKGTLIVSEQVTTPATLTNAYMPGVDLSGARLGGVVAPGLHVYGNGASLARADLSDAVLTGANLGGVSLEQASLYGANLQDAILTGASLKKAKLDRSPSRPGAILIGAHLAGADFTDASLGGADLSNAAVAIPVDSADPTIGGVFVFDIAADQDAYRSELSAWQLVLGTESEKDLTPGQPIGAGLAKAIGQHVTLPGDHRVALAPGATDVWLVSSPSSPSFGLVLWDGFDDQLDEHLFVRPPIPRLTALFRQHRIALSLKTAITPVARDWWIDSNSADLSETDTGYARFRVRPDAGPPAGLVVYGTRLRVRRVQNGQLATYTLDIAPTRLAAAQMDASTHCPDCQVRGDAQTAQKNWAARMRAREVARPPSCVPAGALVCPRPWDR